MGKKAPWPTPETWKIWMQWKEAVAEEKEQDKDMHRELGIGCYRALWARAVLGFSHQAGPWQWLLLAHPRPFGAVWKVSSSPSPLLPAMRSQRNQTWHVSLLPCCHAFVFEIGATRLLSQGCFTWVVNVETAKGRNQLLIMGSSIDSLLNFGVLWERWFISLIVSGDLLNAEHVYKSVFLDST